MGLELVGLGSILGLGFRVLVGSTIIFRPTGNVLSELLVS